MKQCLAITRHQLKRVAYDRTLAMNHISKIERAELRFEKIRSELTASLRNDRTRVEEEESESD